MSARKSILSRPRNHVSLSHNENKTPQPPQGHPDRSPLYSLSPRTRRRLPQRTPRLDEIVCRTRPLEDSLALRYPLSGLEALEERASGPMPRRSCRQFLPEDRLLVCRSPHPGRRSKEPARKGSAPDREKGSDDNRDHRQSNAGCQPRPRLEAASRPLRWSRRIQSRHLTRFVCLRTGRLLSKTVLLQGQPPGLLPNLKLNPLTHRCLASAYLCVCC